MPWTAFGLTLFAGLSTGVGSALAFFARRTHVRFLSASLGFSAGVMVYVSMTEILSKARGALAEAVGAKTGSWAAAGAFFGGMLLIALIDRLVPSGRNPHDARRLEEMAPGAPEPQARERKLMRMGLLAAAAIAIHNFPEGLATFTVALREGSLGIPIAFAVAIHNIPEGISVSIPIYYATGSRAKAFWLSLLSGL